MPSGKNKVNPTTAARKAGLKYTRDTDPGIRRKRQGRTFIYIYPDGNTVTDAAELKRIQGLVIPPAWENVWICTNPDGHLQVTGYDTKGRKQYLYHTEWRNISNETKFYKMLDFIEHLPRLRTALEKDLRRKKIGKEKVVAAAVAIMEKAYIRTGSDTYRKMNGSYGLTTLRDRHVKITGQKLHISFMGKKGVQQEIELSDRNLTEIVKKCRDIPGYELFQYYDEEGNKHTIDSGDINTYIREAMGEGFSAKDIRTWAGSLLAFKHCLEVTGKNLSLINDTERKKNLVEVVRQVSRKLGNTPAVCRKYYIHPLILEAYQNGKLQELLEKHNPSEDSAIEEHFKKILTHLLKERDQPLAKQLRKSLEIARKPKQAK